MYMAPEVFRAEPYNEKADVFSFGIMLYEVRGRSRPRSGRGGADWNRRHLGGGGAPGGGGGGGGGGGQT